LAKTLFVLKAMFQSPLYKSEHALSVHTWHWKGNHLVIPHMIAACHITINS